MKKIMFTILVVIFGLSNEMTLIAQNYGVWREIDSMNIARVGHGMVVLPNGDLLVSGGEADSIHSSTEIYEFTTGKWRFTNPMNVPRALHNLILLNTGKVLAIGGYKEQSCELFDPKTEIWTMTDSIKTFRFGGQAVTKLSDGKILVTGGYYVDTAYGNFIILKKVNIYDPSSELWYDAAPMYLERYNHTATQLNNGRIVVTGGETYLLTTNLCEIYDPTLNIWSEVTSMSEKRSAHSSILLMNGEILTSGGKNDSPILKSCEVYSVKTNQWSPVSDLLISRVGHKIFYLRELDRLFIVGGGLLSFGADTWEIYDPYQYEPEYYDTFSH